MKVGVSLAGGGIRGIAHVGVLKALEEKNIKVAAIAGTSAGSIIATLYAMGYSPYYIYLLFKRYARDIINIRSKPIINGITNFIRNNKIGIAGLSDGNEFEKMYDELARKKGFRLIGDIKMPLLVSAVDIGESKEYIFTNCASRKNIKDNYITEIGIGRAVRASSSFPAIFCPCEYKNHIFMDGGVLNNLPTEELKKVYDEIDLVTTPSGDLVGMVHCNNCTSDLNAWVNLFKEFAQNFGVEDVDMDQLYGTLYNKALEGDKDCGGLLAYNYFSGEHITGFEEGRPLFVRKPDSNFNLANFMRVLLSTALGALKTGLDILMKEEDVKVDKMLGHGGLFKTEGVGQKIMAAAVNAPVSVMKTAGEGGAWGMAILAAYMLDKAEDEMLDTYLSDKVFAGEEGTTIAPDEKDVEGFDEFIKQYQKGLALERVAIDVM